MTKPKEKIETTVKNVTVKRTYYVCPECKSEHTTEKDAKYCAKVDRMPKLPEEEFATQAFHLAVSSCSPIYPCLKCGHPVLSGFCCNNCGTAGDEDGDVGEENEEPFSSDGFVVVYEGAKK